MKLSDFSIRRPVFTIVIMIVFLLLGAVSLTRIPLKLIPSINPPIGAVVATYPDAGPREVLDNVTKPLEDELGTLQGLKDLTSTSQEGSSLIILQFTNDTNIDKIQSDIQNAIDRADLPDDVQNARFLKFDPSQFPIIQLALSTPHKGEDFSDKTRDLERKLSQVKGVASVNTRGLKVDEIKVKLDQEKLKDHHLTQNDVVAALQGSNVSLPGSSVKSGNKQLTTRVLSPLHSVSDIKQVKLTSPTGESVTVAEVSKVDVEPKNDHIITRNNQKPAVLMNVLQQSDANTEQVSQNVQNRLDDLLDQEKYKSFEASTLFDQGDLVDQAVGSLEKALILGAAFAMLVLFFFLRNLKTPLIIGISIPFSVIVTFVLIYFSGFTL
ncbi:MAG TPA: efflux RND transporter permease subunit, partial [Bacillales bacterium]|nr:efflux RND transporter permease subunit [Bacillales bacterium]